MLIREEDEEIEADEASYQLEMMRCLREGNIYNNTVGWVENMARKAAGEEPLPEEDPSNPIFKPVPKQSRLDSFLITNQIAKYCNQINGVAAQSFSRLYLTKALHEN
ncbi:eukaryotic translation initiation factor 3 subunit H-like [Tasmannia lanceolata]|uniref:eukaryotic translation initiation factor 3 subunit H-like n=1 Tax=Tasmannia lanceolata TaxID=3420 RepID=UPI004064BDCB